MNKIFAITTAVCVGLLSALWIAAAQFGSPWQKSEPLEAAVLLLASLDSDCLGCGPDAYVENAEHAMAFGLLASAGVEMADEPLTETAAEWLINNAAPSPGVTGWRLGFAWDAFADGSVNPETTVYGITTALAVRGLIDAFEATGNPTFLDTATAALSYYSRFFTETDNGGYFWYSDQSADDVNVFNVSAMLLGQYARLGVLKQNENFLTLAEKARSDLLAHASSESGYTFWRYSPEPGQHPNDSVHAAYVVQGLLDYAEARGEALSEQSAVSYLETFLVEDGLREWSPVHEGKSALAGVDDRAARLWGAGMLLYTLSEAGRQESASEVASAIMKFYHHEGAFRSTPIVQPTSEARMVAHALLGMARIAR